MPGSAEVEQRYAVCIGINAYDPAAGLSQLAYAERDAQAMDTLLGELGFAPENRCLLLGEQATLQAVNAALSTFILDQPRENDLVVFYFAGHSLPLVINQSAVDEEGAEPHSEVFLTTYDFDRQQIKTTPSFRKQQALGMERLRSTYFEGEGSRKRLFLFDSCYSGDFFGPRYRDEVYPIQGYIKHALGTSTYGRLALSSCLPVQKAAEDAVLGHGRFTYYVLEALSGRAIEALRRDGCLTVNGLFEYLTRTLPDDQRPVLSGVQQDTFTLVCYREKRAETKGLASESGSAVQAEKAERLHAMLSDHTSFLRDRLASFVGREQELADIRRLIAERLPTGGYVTITGQAGQGKSSIIAKLVDDSGQENVAYHFIPFNPGPDQQVGLMRNLMARLILKYDLSDLYVASESRPALRDYFPHVLAEVSAKGGSEVIFLDGLDQLEEDASGVRDLTFLPTNPPAGIVFVLGTRPNDTLKPLKLLKPFDEYQLPNLSRKDFDRILQHRHVTLEHTLADRFYQAMQENALYLDLVAQELARAEEVRPEEVIERVATNPENIFSLSIERLKRQRVEWREVIKPILGILLVAREPFSFAHIRQIVRLDADRIKEGIERLGGLVSSDGSGKYTLFHLKFYDYLRQDERQPQKDYIFASDEEEHWHQTLAQWCEQDNLQLIWEDAPSDRTKQERRVYARNHFIEHLYFAQEWHRVFAILDERSFGRMKVRYDPSTRSYSDDLDLGRKAAASENGAFDEGMNLLPHLWRYTLLRCSLASRADRYPETAFLVLKLLGREQEALGLAELLTDRAKKARILISMAMTQEQQKGGENRKQEAINMSLLMRAYKIACTIEDRDSLDRGSRASTLSELASALEEVQEWAEAERVIATIEDASYRASALLRLVEAFAQAQEWAEAERVIATIEDASYRASALSALVEAFAQAQKGEQAQAVWAEAERVIATIEDGYDRALALFLLADALEEVQEWAEAERVIATIEDASYRASALLRLVEAFAQAQEWAEAERVIAAIEDASARASALLWLASALALAQKREQAQAVWAEAKRVIATIEDASARASALLRLVEALAQAQEWVEAERVIATIEDASTRASALSALAGTLALAQKREQAQTVWAEVERAIATSEFGYNRVSALSALAITLAQAQKGEQAQAVWAEAERVIATIEDGYNRAHTLRELAEALEEVQEWAEAERVIATIENSSIRAFALLQLAGALAQAQKGEQAQAVWAEAERVIATIEDASAQRELTEALAQAQKGEQAQVVRVETERAVATTEDTSSRALASFQLAEALAQAQEWAEAERVIATIEDASDRAFALLHLVGALAQAQEWAEAERVIATIENSSFRALALSVLVGALARAQEWAEAERVIATIEDASDLALALIVLVGALTRAQEWAEAERVIATIENSFRRARALSELAEALAQAQEWAEAERVIATIEDGYNHTLALSELASALAQAQEWAEAERVIATIEDSSRRASALSELVGALAQVQEWAEVERVIATIEDASDRAFALSELAITLAQAQKGEQAQAVWAEAERVIATIEDGYNRASALCELAEALEEVQEWAEAERVIATIEDRNILDRDRRASALSALASALAEAQEWAEAERVIATIEDASTRASALSALADILVKANEYLKLLRVVQRSWQQADRLGFALDVLSLANGLISLQPGIGIELFESFSWADNFLNEEK